MRSEEFLKGLCPLPLVVTSFTAFVFVQARKAHLFRCSSSPQKVYTFRGPHYNADRAQMAVYRKMFDFIYRAKRNKCEALPTLLTPNF